MVSRYKLRSLFILVAVCGVACFIYAYSRLSSDRTLELLRTDIRHAARLEIVHNGSSFTVSEREVLRELSGQQYWPRHADFKATSGTGAPVAGGSQGPMVILMVVMPSGRYRLGWLDSISLHIDNSYTHTPCPMAHSKLLELYEEAARNGQLTPVEGEDDLLQLFLGLSEAKKHESQPTDAQH